MINIKTIIINMENQPNPHNKINKFQIKITMRIKMMIKMTMIAILNKIHNKINFKDNLVDQTTTKTKKNLIIKINIRIIRQHL